jgi:hypothetical protein
MVINNKKPVELVQEVNNEVPSFEEFMKTYEGPVNYDDLNNGDISETKGYGPCSNCGRSDHIFKLKFSMTNTRGYGKTDVYSTEQALSASVDILLDKNSWENDWWFLSECRWDSDLRKASAKAIEDAVRIYRLGGSVNGWLEVKEGWFSTTTTSNFTCGTDQNGKSL